QKLRRHRGPRQITAKPRIWWGLGPCGCWAPPRSFSFVHFGFQETAMNVPAIDIQGVRKAFKRRERDAGAPWWRREQKEKVALHELDLIVEAGGVTGILGPNGSGKSTLIRILGTLLTPDTGRAMVFGWDVVTDALQVRRRVNRVSVEAAFFKELSPWENMVYASRLYGNTSRGTRRR